MARNMGAYDSGLAIASHSAPHSHPPRQPRGALFSRMRRLITFCCLLLAVPVLGVLGAWLALDAQALALLRHQWQTVLPDYALSSLWLSVSVALGVALLMSGKKIRHLPVMDHGHLIGILSIGDLVKAVIEDQHLQIQHLQDYIRA